jgi:hypothetical protein
MTRVRINCSTRRLMILESSSYLGEVLVRRGNSSASRRRWSGMLPGNDWAALVEEACRIDSAGTR